MCSEWLPWLLEEAASVCSEWLPRLLEAAAGDQQVGLGHAEHVVDRPRRQDLTHRLPDHMTLLPGHMTRVPGHVTLLPATHLHATQEAHYKQLVED